LSAASPQVKNELMESGATLYRRNALTVSTRKEGPIMKNINAFAVGMRVAGAARALPAATWTAHAAASAHATASAAARKRRTATGFVDGGSI
jgi:hypothetical protein